ncbi:hypothetical protein CONPUDRAFT_163296 [Coniophora puteana RWD-64-598 SS2]|uniref:Uncharacterized protein n=1 Tax=Coniophora puteana (strain RWD-64-598) TaxID=741705 RepID=A0A5M3MY60_CONPW|nr:uncharacterized protein CONPUDRAFT_163296 [Coniophora puteana RWD-64-598 SS2]EIW84062.1 hypothetical protein CONPUDRAFT_163296 [Coniophora puteana RWD-64-598 SS2]
MLCGLLGRGLTGAATDADPTLGDHYHLWRPDPYSVGPASRNILSCDLGFALDQQHKSPRAALLTRRSQSAIDHRLTNSMSVAATVHHHRGFGSFVGFTSTTSALSQARECFRVGVDKRRASATTRRDIVCSPFETSCLFGALASQR